MTFIKTPENNPHNSAHRQARSKASGTENHRPFHRGVLPMLSAGLQKLKVRWEGGQSGSPKSGLRPGSNVGFRLFPSPLGLCLLPALTHFFLSLSSLSLLFLSDFLFWSSFGTKIYLTSLIYPKGLTFLTFNIFSFLFNCDILKLQNSYLWISFLSACLILMVATKTEICF